MPGNSIVSTLVRSFASANKEQWKRAASHEINWQNPFEKLSWQNNDEIRFFPYYDGEDLTPHDPYTQHQLHPAEDPFLGARQWRCAPYVLVREEIQANRFALDHLVNGADGVFFDLRSTPAVIFDPLLRDIEWSYCSLFFHGGQKHFDDLVKYIADKRLEDDALSGAFFWENRPKKRDVAHLVNETNAFRSLGIAIQPNSPAREIVTALKHGVETIEEYDRSSTNPGAVFRALAFSLSPGVSFLETIAKLKALRALWFQVARAYDQRDYLPHHLHIHVRTEPWVEKSYQPHGNMIVNALAGMASVMGGCDAVTLHAGDDGNETANRVARNVSSILREEAHLNKVSDPLAGSYTLEIMTQQIAEKAWTTFQTETSP